MRSLKTRLISAIGAAALALSIPMTSMASWETPNSGDAIASISGIALQVTKLVGIGSVDLADIKIVYLEDVLDASELVNVMNTLNGLTAKLQLVTLHNTLNNLQILNGSEVLTFGDVLSDNNVDINDVVGAYVFPDGKLLIFSK